MIMTNEHNIPVQFLNFEKSEKYSKGHADISVTTLIDSPRVNILRQEYEKQMTFDVADKIWALFGTAVHKVLESSKE